MQYNIKYRNDHRQTTHLQIVLPRCAIEMLVMIHLFTRFCFIFRQQNRFGNERRAQKMTQNTKLNDKITFYFLSALENSK